MGDWHDADPEWGDDAGEWAGPPPWVEWGMLGLLAALTGLGFALTAVLGRG